MPRVDARQRQMTGYGTVNPPVPISAAAGLLARTSSDANKESWPYVWEHCPPDGERFYQESVVAFPANSTLTNLLQYAVPDGMKLQLTYWMLYYVGIALQDGLNQVTWGMFVNTPASLAGLTAPALPGGYGVPYLDNITISKGSPTNGPWPLPGKYVFNARDIVYLNVETIASFPEAGGQFLSAWGGWQWPAEASS